MDRQAVLGFILIAVLFIFWMFYMTPDPSQMQQQETPLQRDSIDQESSSDARPEEEMFPVDRPDTTRPTDAYRKYGQWFVDVATGEEHFLTVETEKYIVRFNTKGGSIYRWTLKDFKTWDQRPLQLIDWKRETDYNIVFASSDGRFVDTKDLYFRISPWPEGGKIVLEDTASYTIEAVCHVRGDSVKIVKRFVVRGGGYNVDLDIEMVNMDAVIANNEYQVVVHSPALTEWNSVEEASFAEAHAYVDNSRKSIDADDMKKVTKADISGDVAWIAVNNKYFMNALIGRDGFLGMGAYLEGITIPLPNEGQREIYETAFKVKYRGKDRETSSFTIFIGPMEYDLLKAQYEGLEQTLSLGWAVIVRPFSEYLVMPLFSFIHRFIPNFGIVIILFSILIKLLLHPLTKTSLKSMQRMQKLQPMVNELREKHKEDQQKQNMEMMKLYKEYGVNPAGGCLPMLLQMPILFALFSIFRSTIDLRQKPFFGWINDLSGPDILFTLPFKIPLLGMSFISGLALLMAITMFIQQKMTIKDPRQKSMVYMMPVLFWILFNSFPSGLNLYYFMFNILSIGQQWFINKKHQHEPLVKVAQKPGKKKSWTERAMTNLQEKAKEQQKVNRKKR